MQHPLIQAIFSTCSPKDVTAYLLPFLTKERALKIESVLSQRTQNVTVAIESPSDIYNAFAVVRTAEAFGLTDVHIIQGGKKRKRGWNTTLGTSQWTEINYSESLSKTVKELKAKGVSLCGAALGPYSPLEELDLQKPVCLLFGNEKSGLSEEAKSLCDQLFTIEMCGMVQSLNLSVAAGISLYCVTRKMKSGKNNTNLSEEELEMQRAAYYIRSIGFERVEKIISYQRQNGAV